MRTIRFLIIAIVVAISCSGWSQSFINSLNCDLIPPAPQSSRPVEYQMPRPALLTGAVDLTIPIYTISVGNYNLPIYFQYHSNGIKVMDDPAPCGHGWALMPALRATRTILGRPDEHYEFKKNVYNAEDAFECMVQQNIVSALNIKKYDCEHDIITFSLPDKSITKILDFSSGKPEFIGPDQEYTIMADSILDKITVYDPSGIRYTFGSPYEYQPSPCESPGKLRTSWALTEILLPTNQSIKLRWTLKRHSFALQTYLGGYSFFDNPDLREWFNSGVIFDNMDSNNVEEANFQTYGTLSDYLELTRIDFPGGRIDFVYDTTPYIKKVAVWNTTEIVKSAILTYSGDNLLTNINLSDEGDYSMEYYGTSWRSYEDRHSQDWWGYFNRKPNGISLTPKVWHKRHGHITDSIDIYREFGEADRSIDEDAMKTNLLTKIIYPTGGFSTFEYETHKFDPKRSDIGHTEIDPKCNPYLTEGGGLRVKKITTATSDADTAPQEVLYQYSNATVRAVPSISTFIEACNAYMKVPNNISHVAAIRSVNINHTSNYMKYDIGEIPIWYENVTAIYPEGKIEYKNSDIIPMHNRIVEVDNTDIAGGDRSYGQRLIHSLCRVCSKGPQLTETCIYKGTPGNYTLVEKERNTYIAKAPNYNVPTSTSIIRRGISLDGDSWARPDLEYGTQFNTGVQIHTVKGAYEWLLYDISPYYEQLVRTDKTIYTENGEFTTTKLFEYKNGTSLITEIVANSSDGNDTKTQVYYPADLKNDVAVSMVAENIKNLPLKEHKTKNNATITTEVDYLHYGGKLFFPQRIATSYNNTTEKDISPLFTYNHLGNVIGVVDADGVATSWLWGYEGLYPVYKIEGINPLVVGSNFSTIAEYGIAENTTMPAEWITTSLRYKPLVGLTEIKTPSGVITSYDYDSCNRLKSTSINGLNIFNYTYTSGHNVENSVSIIDNPEDLSLHCVKSVYDGLGRETSTTDISTKLSTYIEYDNMGRPYRRSMPSTDTPGQYSWTLTGYEASPRNSVVITTLPGEVWQKNGISSTIRYFSNSSAGEYSCPLLTIDSSENIVCKGNYSANSLLITVSTNEDGHQNYSYADKDGNVIMTAEGRDNDLYYTYNIYDDYGRLRYVLPPNLEKGAYNKSDRELADKAFIYKYNGRGQLVYSKIPGCAPSLTRYSTAGRVIAEHTPAMGDGRWLLHFYDKYGRGVLTMLTYPSEAELNDLCTNVRIATYTGAETYGGYSFNKAISFPNHTLQLASYYDTYDFIGSIDSDLAPVGPVGKALGLLTGERDYNIEHPKGYTTTYCYNTKGELVQRHQRYINGVQHKYYTYNKLGKPTRCLEGFVHSKKQYVRETLWTYDSAGRLVKADIDENGSKAWIKLSYGSNGLLEKEEFSNTLERSYAYDEHGWLTSSVLKTLKNVEIRPGITTKAETFYPVIGFPGTKPGMTLNLLYSQHIYYDKGAKPRYSGCPSAVTNTIGGRYDYTFDNHDRLVKADYKPNVASQPDDYSTEYTYDEVANPQTVVRKGIINANDGGTPEFGVLDNLVYSYQGNQVSSITNGGEGIDFYGRTGFPLTDAILTWNSAGLLESDSSRGIKGIIYNYQGLPMGISYDNEGVINETMKYSVKGELLQVRSLIAPDNKFSYRNYSGDRIFEGDSLCYSRFNGGYFDSHGVPHFTHKDYQGSIVMVSDSTGKVVQNTQYYPYGEPHSEPVGQPFLFSEKERLGLTKDYAYGPRRFNASGIFWSAPDIYAGHYRHLSPYVYCAGNPVYFADPTGCHPIYSSTGTFLGTDDEGLQGDFIILKQENFKQGMSKVDADSLALAQEDISEGVLNIIKSHYKTLSDRPDYDGYLTFEEANEWYRNGNGQPLYVDITQLDLTGLLYKNFDENKNLFNLLYGSWKRFVSLKRIEEGLVFGSVTFELSSNNLVKADHDTYDFDMKPWDMETTHRNILTIIGKWVAGKGKPYKIYIYGETKIE